MIHFIWTLIIISFPIDEMKENSVNFIHFSQPLKHSTSQWTQTWSDGPGGTDLGIFFSVKWIEMLHLNSRWPHIWKLSWKPDGWVTKTKMLLACLSRPQPSSSYLSHAMEALFTNPKRAYQSGLSPLCPCHTKMMWELRCSFSVSLFFLSSPMYICWAIGIEFNLIFGYSLNWCCCNNLCLF